VVSYEQAPFNNDKQVANFHVLIHMNQELKRDGALNATVFIFFKVTTSSCEICIGFGNRPF